MIFVTVGSQKFQFNRLLIEIDRLVECGLITDEVFAQTGYSDYEPRNYGYKNFLDRDEFTDIMNKSDKVITHGGTGAIICAIKKRKKVIAVPRLAKFEEHVDDHQLQIIDEFKKMNFIKGVDENDTLAKLLVSIDNESFKAYESNTKNIINSIEKLINKI